LKSKSSTKNRATLSQPVPKSRKFALGMAFGGKNSRETMNL
jgi:hypothetical protein